MGMIVQRPAHAAESSNADATLRTTRPACVQFSVLYRVLQTINASYGLAVAWMYIAAFVASLSMLFVFPQITLLAFFLGLASLGLTIGLGAVIDGITRRMARRTLTKGRCPRCSQAGGLLPIHADDSVCDHCGSEFKIDGTEITSRERSHFIDELESDRDSVPLMSPHAPRAEPRLWHGT